MIGLYISETIMYIDKEHLEQSQEKSIGITLAEHLTLHFTSKFEKKPLMLRQETVQRSASWHMDDLKEISQKQQWLDG